MTKSRHLWNTDFNEPVEKNLHSKIYIILFQSGCLKWDFYLIYINISHKMDVIFLVGNFKNG